MHCSVLQFIFLASLAAKTLSSKDVRFLIGTLRGVKQYNNSNLSTYDIFPSKEWVLAVDYHLSKNLLFMFSSKYIYKTSLNPKTFSSWTLVRNVFGFGGFAVDWVHDRIYWANSGESQYIPKHIIISMDLNGGNESVVLRRSAESAPIWSMQIDPYHGMLFWKAGDVVESFQLAGNGFKTNLSTTGVTVLDLALDLAGQRVYYVGRNNLSTALYSMDYEGGYSYEHFSAPQLDRVYGLGLLRRHVYWANYDYYDENGLFMVPLKSQSERRVKRLVILSQAIYHMRVVHPELQKQPNGDLCQNMGCEYRCTTQRVRAQCDCPEGQKLEKDRITCSHKNKEERDKRGNGKQDARDKNKHILRGNKSPNDTQRSLSSVGNDNSDNITYLEGLALSSDKDNNIDAISRGSGDNYDETTTVNEAQVNEGKETSIFSNNLFKYSLLIAIIVFTMAVLRAVRVFCKSTGHFSLRNVQESCELARTAN